MLLFVLLALGLGFLLWWGGCEFAQWAAQWWKPEEWCQNGVANSIVIVFMVLSLSAGIICVRRARFKVLQGRKFLGVFQLAPLTPRWKNIWKSGGIALILLAGGLFFGVLATFCVGSSYSAWSYFMHLLKRVTETKNLVDSQRSVLSIFNFIVWLIEAAFLGFVVTFIINLVGLGKKSD